MEGRAEEGAVMEGNRLPSTPPRVRPELSSKVYFHVPLGIGLGIVTHILLNAARRRPMMYEPWWHVINASIGAYAGYHYAIMIEDTDAFSALQFKAYSKLPSWVYNQLAPEELDSELRHVRVKEFGAAFQALSEIEEREFLAAKAAQKLA